jgi:hypothetical protein
MQPGRESLLGWYIVEVKSLFSERTVICPFVQARYFLSCFPIFLLCFMLNQTEPVSQSVQNYTL